jgi:hypothetical protein
VECSALQLEQNFSSESGFSGSMLRRESVRSLQIEVQLWERRRAGADCFYLVGAAEEGSAVVLTPSFPVILACV